jgi:hypothetical protein
VSEAEIEDLCAVYCFVFYSEVLRFRSVCESAGEKFSLTRHLSENNVPCYIEMFAQAWNILMLWREKQIFWPLDSMAMLFVAAIIFLTATNFLLFGVVLRTHSEIFNS